MTAGRPTRWLAGLIALPLLCGTILVAGPASAADDPGQWYFDALNLDAIAASGITGDGVTIAIMDSPLNDQVPALVGANVTVQPSLCLDDAGVALPSTSTDTSGYSSAIHGTGVVSVIAGTGAANDGQAGVRGVAPGATVLYYADAFGNDGGGLHCVLPDGDNVGGALALDINSAIDAGADIISISSGLAATVELSDAIARAHREGVVVLGALPNDQFSATGDWPSAANGVVAVQRVDSSAQATTAFAWASVSGPGVDILTQGREGGSWADQSLTTGTSLATPIVAGFLALVLEKYPDATGNQLIQTLIRNTGGEEHELVRNDDLGYGIASATRMLEVDPTQYPDENPLLVEGDALPSVADSTTASTGAPTAEPADPDDPATVVSVLPLIIGGAVGLLVLVGIIVLIIILATRRSRSSAGPR